MQFYGDFKPQKLKLNYVLIILNTEMVEAPGESSIKLHFRILQLKVTLKMFKNNNIE